MVNGYTAFHYSVNLGQSSIAEFYISNLEDKNPSLISNNHRTPMHEAAQNGHLKVVKALTSVVNDKNPKDAHDLTPLHLASLNGRLSIVEHLVKFVPDMNIQTDSYLFKRTPLYYASKEGHLEVVKLLLKKGANPTLETSKNIKPLGIAQKNKHSDVANYLKNYMNYAQCDHQCTKFPDDCSIIGKYHLLISKTIFECMKYCIVSFFFAFMY